MSLMSLAVVDYLTIFGIFVPLVGLFGLKLALDEVHLAEAHISDLIFAH